MPLFAATPNDPADERADAVQPAQAVGAEYWERIWIYRIGGLLLGIPLVMLLASDDFPGVQLSLMLGVLVVLWRAPSALILLAVQAYLVLQERPTRGGGDGLFAGSVTLLTLLVVLLAERVRVCRIARNAVAATTGRRPVTMPPMSGRLGQIGWDGARLVGFAAVAIAGAATLMALVPESDSARRDYRLRPSEMRAITIGMLLMGVYLATSLIASEWSWRKLTPSQARIYLRAVLMGWLGSDVKVAAGPDDTDWDAKPMGGKK